MCDCERYRFDFIQFRQFLTTTDVENTLWNTHLRLYFATREYQHYDRPKKEKSYKVRHRTHVSSARRMIRDVYILSTPRACIAERNIRSETRPSLNGCPVRANEKAEFRVFRPKRTPVARALDRRLTETIRTCRPKSNHHRLASRIGT